MDGGYVSGSCGAFSLLAVLRGQAGHEKALIFAVSVIASLILAYSAIFHAILYK